MSTPNQQSDNDGISADGIDPELVSEESRPDSVDEEAPADEDVENSPLDEDRRVEVEDLP